MSQFMVMIHESEAAPLSAADTRALIEEHAAYEQTLRAASAYLDGVWLRPSAEGRRVLGRDGKVVTDPGPFDDKVLSRYYVLEAASLDAALALAQTCPLSPGAELDVRPVMKGDAGRDKTSQRGRVFAFAVGGHAGDERAWIEVMDRIDESTRGDFGERFLGGVRLDAPGRGRRIGAAASGGRRAVFDGPFLESKEVIGGLFFMRMQSVDEAAAWATESAFVKHGSLEVRELWRS
jgi:hypothetical protein